MKNKKITLAIIAIIVIIVAGSFFFKQETPASNNTITIGAIIPVTGYASIDGESIQKGITLAKEDLQQKGTSINVEVFDDATDPKKTISGIELMKSKGVNSVIGLAWTSQASAAAPVLTKNNMIGYAPAVTDDVVDGSVQEKSSMVFGIPAIAKIKDPSATWMKENNVKKLMIVTANLTWGMKHGETWKKAAEENGVEVIINETYTYDNEASVISQLLIKAKKEGVDGIVWTGGEAGAVTLIKKSQELNYNVPILGDYFIRDVVMNKKVTPNGMNLSVIDTLQSKSFDEKYFKKFGSYPVNANSLATYNLVMIAVDTEKNHKNNSLHDYVLENKHDVYEGEYKFEKNGTPTNVVWVVTKI